MNPSNSTSSADPLANIARLASDLPSPNQEKHDQVKTHLEQVQHGLHPVGKLDDVLAWLAGWTDTDVPEIIQPGVFVFVGAHTVAGEIFGIDPTERALERVKSLSSGAAGIRGIAGEVGAGFQVLEMSVSAPSQDIRTGPSLKPDECAKAIAFGMASVTAAHDFLILGSAGCGTATAAAAIVRGLYGGTSEYWANGNDPNAQARIEAVRSAIQYHKEAQGDPVKLLQTFGGHDIAGLFGALLAAAHQGTPVLLDGFVVCAAAAVLHALNPHALDHCYAAHITMEPAHGALLDRIDKRPLFDLGVGVGDGSGAGMVLGMIKTACAAHAEVLSG